MSDAIQTATGTEQDMIDVVASTGGQYSYTTVKGVVQPLTVHRTSASPRTGQSRAQGPVKGRTGPEARGGA